jgi:hypothetical protein
MLDLILRQYGYTDAQRETQLAVFSLQINSVQFEGSAYWFMWPFGVQSDFENKINDIESGVISDTSDTYGRVKTAYTNAVSN